MLLRQAIFVIFAFTSGFVTAQTLPTLPTDAIVDCGVSRDPARCAATQAALAACSQERGKRKTACLAERMPPVDCSKTKNPSRCEAIERAKQTCAGKSGKAQKACLKGEKPSSKAKKSAQKSAKKAAKKSAKKSAKSKKKTGKKQARMAMENSYSSR